MPERSYVASCAQGDEMFDGDDSTSCYTDASHTDAVLIGFESTAQASAVEVVMSGYTGTVWLRARSHASGGGVDYSSYLSCIGGEYWGNAPGSGFDVSVDVTSAKAAAVFGLGALQDVDCIGIAMSPYHGSPVGVYDPRPYIYGVELLR